MKITLKILLPMLSDVIGRKELEVQFAGETVGDLVEYLVTRYGRKARQALYDTQGHLDPMVQVLLNGRDWVSHDQFDTVLHDGDLVMIMVMMGGG